MVKFLLHFCFLNSICYFLFFPFTLQVEINEKRFLSNMISVIISQYSKKLRSLRKRHERDWYSEPIEVNAYNLYSQNAISKSLYSLTIVMKNSTSNTL